MKDMLKVLLIAIVGLVVENGEGIQARQQAVFDLYYKFCSVYNEKLEYLASLWIYSKNLFFPLPPGFRLFPRAKFPFAGIRLFLSGRMW